MSNAISIAPVGIVRASISLISEPHEEYFLDSFKTWVFDVSKDILISYYLITDGELKYFYRIIKIKKKLLSQWKNRYLTLLDVF